jgi:hypothetical protein
MQSVEITFGRALKVWWSYVWRAMVLTIPVYFVLLAFMVSFMLPSMSHPGTKPDPAQFQAMMGKFSFVWLVMMVASLLVQILAMRWMLKTKWSDFRLQPTSDGLDTAPPANWEPRSRS